MEQEFRTGGRLAEGFHLQRRLISGPSVISAVLAVSLTASLFSVVVLSAQVAGQITLAVSTDS